jgi:hypothetical protein
VTGKITYEFSAELWQYPAPGGWFFVSLPAEMSVEIRQNLKQHEEGWGRLKITAKTGKSQWESAMWFDTQRHTYLLPIKAEIRRKENLEADREIQITIWI